MGIKTILAEGAVLSISKNCIIVKKRDKSIRKGLNSIVKKNKR